MRFKSIRKALLNFLLTLTVVLSAIPVQSQLTPFSVISRIGEFPLKDYTPEGETHELKNRQIENQQQSEECYLFAVTNYLQVANANHFGHEKSPQISGPYLFTVKLLAYIDEALTSQEDSHLYLRGGNIQDAIALISAHGILPEKSWRPKVPFHQWPLPDLYEHIEELLQKYQAHLSVLRRVKSENSEEYREALQTALQRVKAEVFKWSGPLPEQFLWKDHQIDPIRFAKDYGIQQARDFQLYSPGELFIDENYLRQRMKSALQPLGARFSIHQRSWEDIEGRMRKALDQGVPVLLGLQWGKDGHVLTAVGYELRNNKVYAWKFLNSWGRWTRDGTVFYKSSDVRRNTDQVWIIR